MSHTEKDAMSILRTALEFISHGPEVEDCKRVAKAALAATQPERSEGTPAGEGRAPESWGDSFMRAEIASRAPAAPVQHDASEKFPPVPEPYLCIEGTKLFTIRQVLKYARAALATRKAKAAPEYQSVGSFLYEGIGYVATSSDDPRGIKLYRPVTASEAKADAAPVDDILHAAQSRMWEALDRKSCPGVWMQIASDAILNFKTDSYGGALPPPATVSNTTAGASIGDDAELSRLLDDVESSRVYNRDERRAAVAEYARRAPAVGMVAAPDAEQPYPNREDYSCSQNYYEAVVTWSDKRIKQLETLGVPPTDYIIEQAAAICDCLSQLFPEDDSFAVGYTLAATRAAKDIRSLKGKK